MTDNYNQVKEKENTKLHQTWEEYDTAQTDLRCLSNKLIKGENRYKKGRTDQVEKVHQYVEYVDSIKDVKKEIDEKQEYQFLNHVVS